MKNLCFHGGNGGCRWFYEYLCCCRSWV